jgi:hypothetical protein
MVMHMKKMITFFTIFLVISHLTSGQNHDKTSNQTNIITIPIKDVELAPKPLESVNFLTAFRKRVDGKIEAYEHRKQNDSLIATKLHPFVAALHYGFADHRPVVISPDMIWLIICQNFAIHIHEIPDNKRREFQNQDEKIELWIRRNMVQKRERDKRLALRFPGVLKSNQRVHWRHSASNTCTNLFHNRANRTNRFRNQPDGDNQ